MCCRYDYFHSVVNDSGVLSEQLKNRIKLLESELELWKRRCFEYEKLQSQQNLYVVD